MDELIAYGIENCAFVSRDCQDLQLLGFTESGVYRVIPADTFDGFDVYCDMTTDRGGWLRRLDDSVDFYRTWQEYATEFGEKTGEHWLGNIALNIITSQYRYQLRVELGDWNGNTLYVNYQMFRIGTTAEKYKLGVDGYSGNAVNACGIESCNTFVPRDCQDVQCLGHTDSGVYRVIPVGTLDGYDVYCDMATDAGGWLVFQRRINGSVDFFRTWNEYAIGFGDKSGEHWLGNIPLSIITSQYRYQLRVDLQDWDGNIAFANYQVFRIGDFGENFKLGVAGYSGNAGDSLSYHSGAIFSTNDKTYPSATGQDCATTRGGAWWFVDCLDSHLNGQYYHGGNLSSEEKRNGIQWFSLKNTYLYSFKTAEMKIKRL